ncbi:MAG TPA: hypothetical protein VMS65_00350 [Polyangiaceae bacterium]|nr:hypothetical protein [Polyangiaceae bacterium]
MPEPVTCHPPVPGSSVIECDDVLIGPDPAPERSESHVEAAGVRSLVERHTPPLFVRTIAPDPGDTPLGDIALKCSAEVLGGAIAVGGAARLHPALAVLGVAKASIELAACGYESIAKSQVESATQQAVEICERAGGAVAGVVDRKVMCLGGDTEALR